MNRLENALHELGSVREQVFRHWQPFTKEDYEEAMKGEFLDLDEVIRSLQGRAV